MPLTEEFRAFVLDGKIMAVMKYWDEVQYPVNEPNFESVLNMVASVPANFFTVDLARLESGEWMIVELGDGQVAGLPDNMNLKAFYDALQHSKQEGVGEVLPRASALPRLEAILSTGMWNSFSTAEYAAAHIRLRLSKRC